MTDCFFLSKTPVVKITMVGDPCDVDSDITGSLYHFADQYVASTEVPDRWGRNYIDKQFLALCSRLYVIATCCPDIAFKSLTTRKEDGKYFVRVRYNDVDVELEIDKMYQYFTDKLKGYL